MSTHVIAKRIISRLRSVAGDSEYLHQVAAARYLGLSARTLRRRTGDGTIPAFRDGRRTVYARTDLDAYIRRLPVDPTAEREQPPQFRRD